MKHRKISMTVAFTLDTEGDGKINPEYLQHMIRGALTRDLEQYADYMEALGITDEAVTVTVGEPTEE